MALAHLVEKTDQSATMHPLKRRTLMEQTASHLREGIATGRWRDRLPGVRRLAEELDVSNDTVRAALKLLESDGSLQPRGAGKARHISPARSAHAGRRVVRVALLPAEPLQESSAHTQRTMLRLVSAIEHAGHECSIAAKPLAQIGHRIERLARLVAATTADAWVAYTPSYEVLSWFVQNKLPILALGGHSQTLPVACSRTDISAAMIAAVDALVAHRHRRIVLISPRLWREPSLHPAAQTFLDRMTHHRVPCSSYNLPDWGESAEGLEHLLRVLFQATPPTALLFLKPAHTVAVLSFLAERGLRVPQDVSLVSIVSDPIFGLRRPPIAHFHWPVDPHIRRITRWVRHLALGQTDRGTKIVHAEFIPGGTIGPLRAPRT